MAEAQLGHERKGEMVKVGTLQELAGMAGSTWLGKISPRERTDISSKDIERTIDSLNEYYFTLPKGVTFTRRCGDGRDDEAGRKNVQNGKRQRTVGPQVFGGTPGPALARTLVENNAGTHTFAEMVSDTSRRFAEAGIHIGAHTDEHAHGDKCGCGAIDNVPSVLELFSNEEKFPQIQAVAKAVLGDQYDAHIARKLFFAAEKTQNGADTFLERHEDGTYPYRMKIIEDIKKNGTTGHEIQRMLGSHNEVALVINCVPGTTFNREQLNADTDNKTQAFSWDFWVEPKDAKILYPNNEEKQKEYIHARALLSVATAMTLLKDGSMQVIVRKPA